MAHVNHLGSTELLPLRIFEQTAGGSGIAKLEAPAANAADREQHHSRAWAAGKPVRHLNGPVQGDQPHALCGSSRLCYIWFFPRTSRPRGHVAIAYRTREAEAEVEAKKSAFGEGLLAARLPNGDHAAGRW